MAADYLQEKQVFLQESEEFQDYGLTEGSRFYSMDITATPPKANHRVKGYHQQESAGTVSLEKGGIKRIVFEQIVGGTNQRTETGETLIAIESKNGKLYHLLTPISDNMPVLNDREVNPILKKQMICSLSSIQNEEETSVLRMQSGKKEEPFSKTGSPSNQY